MAVKVETNCCNLEAEVQSKYHSTGFSHPYDYTDQLAFFGDQSKGFKQGASFEV